MPIIHPTQKWRRIIGLWLLLCCIPTICHASVNDRVELDIPPSDLSKALILLAREADISIVFSPKSTDRVESGLLRGTMTPLQALDVLLEDSGLEYKVINYRVIAIVTECDTGGPCQTLDTQLAPEGLQAFYIEELIVRGKQITGSRFRQPNLKGFSPVDIITGPEIRLSGAPTVSDLLKFIPAVSGNSTSTAISNGGDGTARVTLRGLPATNTLVLLNGYRVANNGIDAESVDLNAIPPGAIDRIEILKDGASAIYGSDAIAGVINIILKKEFSGVALNSYYGISGHSDNKTSNFDITTGYSGDQTSFLLTASRFEQDGFYSRDRELSENADNRAMGGVDLRSTATPAARLLVNGEALVLSEQAGGYPPGDDPAQFRPATDEDRYNYQSATSSLSPAKHTSFYLHGGHQITDELKSSLELGYTDNTSTVVLAPPPVFTAFESVPVSIAADNPFNPFGVKITDARKRLLELGPRVQKDESTFRRAAIAIEGAETGWEWKTRYQWSGNTARETATNLVNALNLKQGLGPAADCSAPCVPINFFGPPGSLTPEQLDFLRVTGRVKNRTEMQSLAFDVVTAPFATTAGDIEFALGLELRREEFNSNPNEAFLGGFTIGNANRNATAGDRNVRELYVESLLPLVSAQPGVHSLDASVALRFSEYSDFGSTTNPKVSLKYQPVEDLVFRATYSEGFRAPSLQELFLGQTESLDQIFDPCSLAENVGVLPGCHQQSDPLRVQFLTLLGGDPNLEPETSRNVTAGLLWSLPFPAGAELSVDYYRIKQNDAIDTNAQFFVDQSAASGQYSDRVIRDDDGNILFVVATNTNIDRREVEGVDLGLSWRQFNRSLGTFNYNISASHIHKYLAQLAPEAPRRNLAGTFVDDASQGNGALPKWKIRFNLLWQRGNWEAAYTLNYISHLLENIPFTDRQRTIDSWTSHDAQLSYLFNRERTRISLGVDNLLDEEPPFAASAFNDNFDARTYDLIGRFFYLRLSHSI